MALQLSDIFPLSTSQGATVTAKILEPHTCSRQYNAPTELITSEARLVYTKRISKPYYMFQYQYKGIMAWEYQLLEEFFIRMHGQYETFYVVDWSAQYRISASAVGSVTVDRIAGLETETGFGGNILLLYNPVYTGTPNKQILTITDASTTTVTVNEVVNTTLANATGSLIYVLYPSMFDGVDIKYTYVDFCIDKRVANYIGYGNKSLYGFISDTTIPFVQVGVMK